MGTKMITCGSCNATFDASLTACPYCGTMNYQGAEAEYMSELEGIRLDLQGVAQMPRDSVGKEFRRVGICAALLTLAFLGVGLLVSVPQWLSYGAGDSEEWEQYLWEQEHFTVMDQMLADGQYDELAAYIEEQIESSDYRYSISYWLNSSFTHFYDNIKIYYATLDRLASGEELSDYEWEDFYYAGKSILGAPYYYGISSDVLEYVNQYYAEVQTDFQTRWGYTDEEMQEILDELKSNDDWSDWESDANEVQSLRGQSDPQG